MWYVIEGIYKGERYFYLIIGDGLAGMYKTEREAIEAGNDSLQAA